ncbi:transcription repressor OFP6-like [Henckelia pumila]|uniref:transcription repressor OFP6-like n=1 Tax=Henckelia pumila TaxID=405737 RepID=UPI003C6E833C
MSRTKKHHLLDKFGIDFGCRSSSCTRPSLSAVFCPSTLKSPSFPSTSSSAADTPPPACFSYDTDSEIMRLRSVNCFGSSDDETVALEKDSDDPYLDFRQSMLRMILEKQIYSKDDLKELLNCFLHLNSPYHHGTIVRVFTEIWNDVYSVKPMMAAAASPASPGLHEMWVSRDF